MLKMYFLNNDFTISRFGVSYEYVTITQPHVAQNLIGISADDNAVHFKCQWYF